jgi:hypothetical protein
VLFVMAVEIFMTPLCGSAMMRCALFFLLSTDCECSRCIERVSA